VGDRAFQVEHVLSALEREVTWTDERIAVGQRLDQQRRFELAADAYADAERVLGVELTQGVESLVAIGRAYAGSHDERRAWHGQFGSMQKKRRTRSWMVTSRPPTPRSASHRS
jgi:hypothetical protein